MSEVMFSGGTSLEAATYGVVGDADEPGMLLAPGSASSRGASSTSIFIGAAGSAGWSSYAGVRAVRGFGIDENTGDVRRGHDCPDHQRIRCLRLRSPAGESTATTG